MASEELVSSLTGGKRLLAIVGDDVPPSLTGGERSRRHGVGAFVGVFRCDPRQMPKHQALTKG